MILGLVWGRQLHFSERVRRLVARANLRNGIMARLARCNWGRDMGITRSARKALIFSLCKYGLTVFGGGLYHVDFAKLDTLVANIAARIITRVSRTARPAILRATAGAFTISNVFAKQCAFMLDRTQRAVGSSIRGRMLITIGNLFGAANWRVVTSEKNARVQWD